MWLYTITWSEEDAICNVSSCRYNAIFLPDGRSLKEAASQIFGSHPSPAEAGLQQEKAQPVSPDGNEDECAVCSDGGDLLLCDACPKAYHLGAL